MTTLGDLRMKVFFVLGRAKDIFDGEYSFGQKGRP
jgi:hypothetical protein